MSLRSTDNIADAVLRIVGKPVPTSFWVIYESPIDYPGQFVARRWEGQRGVTGEVFNVRPMPQKFVADTLPAVREQARHGRSRLTPDASDNPVLVEVWV